MNRFVFFTPDTRDDVPVTAVCRAAKSLDLLFERAVQGVVEPGVFVVGGFSSGARRACREAIDLGARGVVCCGFPFHARGDPSQTRLHELPTLPTLVVQGARDAHGDEARVRSYSLPAHIQMCWLPDGNHHFVPRSKSGVRWQDNAARAEEAVRAFVQSLSSS